MKFRFRPMTASLAVSILSLFVFQTPSTAFTINLEKTPKTAPKTVTPKKLGPVILDARPAFEYATGHLRKSYNIRWQDFSQTERGHRGALDPDFSFLARKLGAHGVVPQRPVVVVGDGAHGNGEEGRVAWMLSVLGIKKIDVKNFKDIKGPLTVDTDDEEFSVPPWDPHPDSVLRLRKSELANLLAAKDSNVVLIDVRSPEEFKNHIPGAVNIPWTTFISDTGEMAGGEGVIRVLRQNKVAESKRLVFYSNQGVRSGYVTFAAFRAGLNASNYDGGLSEWDLH